MSEKPQESCKRCRFWEWYETNGYGVDIGRCLRFPPVLDRDRAAIYDDAERERLGNVIFFDWPLTPESVWCGEYAPPPPVDDPLKA